MVGVYDDLVVSVLPITPAPPPPQQTYDWGLKHIRVDDAHDEMPTVTGTGVQVAILDTGVGPHADLPRLSMDLTLYLEGCRIYTPMTTDMGHTLRELLPRGRIMA